ncbi:MAG: hypothetical protein WCL30_05945 [Pseudomonadota bacterium]
MGVVEGFANLVAETSATTGQGVGVGAKVGGIGMGIIGAIGGAAALAGIAFLASFSVPVIIGLGIAGLIGGGVAGGGAGLFSGASYGMIGGALVGMGKGIKGFFDGLFNSQPDLVEMSEQQYYAAQVAEKERMATALAKQRANTLEDLGGHLQATQGHQTNLLKPPSPAVSAGQGRG